MSKSSSNNALKLITFLVFGILSLQKTFAQDNLREMRVIGLTGRCIRVVVAGRYLPAKCSPDPSNALLLNTSYPDGRSGFYVATDTFVLTFSGMGSEQIKTSLDSVVQPVDLILFNRLSNADPLRPMKLRAAGTCSFENPARGVPIKIQCSAQTEQGQFALEFSHDGREPMELTK